MRLLLSLFTLLLLPLLSQAQFTQTETEKALTIYVTDGTDIGRRSTVQAPGGAFSDPIRPLGMTDAIQAAAFLDRPIYGKIGFILIFCVNDSIGDDQGVYIIDNKIYRGVYRLIRQRISINEETPEGMLPYRLSGTVFFLGIS